MPGNRNYSDKFCDNGILEIMAHDGIPISIANKNLVRKNKVIYKFEIK